MKIQASILLQEIEDKVTELVPLIESLQKYAAESMETIELADIAFAVREAEKHIDVLEKRMNTLSSTAQTRCSIVMAMTGLDTVRTDHCTATSAPKPWYKIPYKREKDPEQWDEIMSNIGVSELANKRDLVRINAPGLMDYCGALLGEGKQPPLGIDPKEMTGMHLNLRITKKRS